MENASFLATQQAKAGKFLDKGKGKKKAIKAESDIEDDFIVDDDDEDFDDYKPSKKKSKKATQSAPMERARSMEPQGSFIEPPVYVDNGEQKGKRGKGIK